MIHQLRYVFHKGGGLDATAENIHAARAAWLEGRTLPGVTVTPISWNRGPARDTRRAITRGGYIGAAGIVKEYDHPNRTLCDYDTGARAPSLHGMIRLASYAGLRVAWVRYDRTRHGWHVVIEWRRAMKPLERLVLQFALGSDFKRERYNTVRLLSGKADGNERWNLLFDSKVTRPQKGKGVHSAKRTNERPKTRS